MKSKMIVDGRSLAEQRIREIYQELDSRGVEMTVKEFEDLRREICLIRSGMLHEITVQVAN